MTPEISPDPAALPLRGARRLSLTIPPSGPLYEGHFPGRPILPGVGLLDLALRALSGGASPPLREIATLRLRRLVAPGDVLEVEAQALAPEGRVRLEVRRGAEVVASAVVTFGEPSTGPAAAAAPELHAGEGSATPATGAGASGAPRLDDLLPHRPPMRFVEAIARELEDGVACTVRIGEGSAFSAGGFAPALVALEMAAQAAAVCEGVHRFREAGEAAPRVGYLVGARDVRFARSRVPSGETLLAAVRLSGIALPLCTYAFDVAQGSEVVASGTVSTWITAKGA